MILKSSLNTAKHDRTKVLKLRKQLNTRMDCSSPYTIKRRACFLRFPPLWSSHRCHQWEKICEFWQGYGRRFASFDRVMEEDLRVLTVLWKKICVFWQGYGRRFASFDRVMEEDLRVLTGLWKKICVLWQGYGRRFASFDRVMEEDLRVLTGSWKKICEFWQGYGRKFASFDRVMEEVKNWLWLQNSSRHKKRIDALVSPLRKAVKVYGDNVQKWGV